MSSTLACAQRLPRRRPLARPVRPQGDDPRRARDARPDGDPQGVRPVQAARRRPHLRFVAHDDPDRRADRDPDRARRRGALGELQHLLDPGSRGGGGRRRAGGHRRGAERRAGVRLEGRDARGVLVVHRADDDVARGSRRQRLRRPEHDPRRRRRRHAARPQGCRVRARGRGARPDVGVQPGAGDRARTAAALAQERPAEVDAAWRPASTASPRRPRPASSASTRWRPTASCCSRRSTSTTRSPSRSSTTSTAAGTRSSTPSAAPPT